MGLGYIRYGHSCCTNRVAFRGNLRKKITGSARHICYAPTLCGRDGQAGSNDPRFDTGFGLPDPQEVETILHSSERDERKAKSKAR